MTASAMIHVRVDEKIKAEAAETLGAMGLSVSDAVRVFLTRVVEEKRIPFIIKVPNSETQAAMQEADSMMSEQEARFTSAQGLIDDIEVKTKKHQQ